jgi:hypothetical protein
MIRLKEVAGAFLQRQRRDNRAGWVIVPASAHSLRFSVTSAS